MKDKADILQIWKPPVRKLPEIHTFEICPVCGCYSVTCSPGGGVNCIRSDCNYWFCY